MILGLVYIYNLCFYFILAPSKPLKLKINSNQRPVFSLGIHILHKNNKPVKIMA